MSRFTYRAWGESDIGNVKKQNEDAYLLKAANNDSEQILFALVADGMGGLSNGDVASLGVKRAFEKWFMEDLPKTLKEKDFEDALSQQWQQIILSENETLNKAKAPSGTTLTALLLYNGRFFTANIGDSRIYRLNKGRLYQLTVDHSWVQEALKAGYDPEEIERDPRRNTLTRCIGAGLSENPETDYTTSRFDFGDYFLLCSDGLRHLITTDEMRRVLENETLTTNEKAELLIETAKERRERDNITAIVIRCEAGDEAEDFAAGEAAAETAERLDRTVKLDRLPV